MKSRRTFRLRCYEIERSKWDLLRFISTVCVEVNCAIFHEVILKIEKNDEDAANAKLIKLDKNVGERWVVRLDELRIHKKAWIK